MEEKLKITRHSVFKNAINEAKWLNDNIRWHRCSLPESHLSHLPLYGGRFNNGNAANIWYRKKRIDLYNIKILDKIKEFAELFNYDKIEIYESE